MIRYLINKDKKQIELLSGGHVEELKDLLNQFEGYTFTVGNLVLNGGQTKVINGESKYIINKIEHH